MRKAAEILGISHETLRGYIEDGTVKGAYKQHPDKRTSPWIVPAKEVDRIIDLRKQQGEGN